LSVLTISESIAPCTVSRGPCSTTWSFGVTDGYKRDLEIQGVGYRAALDGNVLVLSVGFSHPVRMSPPDGVSYTLDGNTRVSVVGIDKQLVGEEAARIRRVRPPEPYKGKGIRYAGERVRRKAGKAGKAK
jgi:large subunit ribosomal protein L6